MRTFDLTPLHRFAIGFDNVSRLLDAASRLDEQAVSYPPYNIEKTGETEYRITMAVAGFGEDDLSVTTQENTLVIAGRLDRTEEPPARFLHRGIAGRAFERKFELADHIKVVGATLVNGLLHVDLVREVPEEKQPRQIAITRASAPSKALENKTIETQAA
ncbi:Hsp20 family protein [Pararhodospirillum oryzae]|uniref:Heat-shock protein Hsp20 n=1 Tax=Pararhodospirillum oryzae TaxID=478448 RepID=A0A512HBQ5_9PROT|nr:Hsp20 family protein [Pararhodospirillum oryzae]GEO82886.1 heat-shock protein Hsp20 [Pararhodospirillum oryzae]